jgi:ABC-type transport system involved in multi-copper enzyme maturation permease subunit
MKLRIILWKEWHEEYPWLLSLVAAMLGYGWIEYRFPAMSDREPLNVVPIMVSLIFGIRTFALDLANQTLAFLFSRPISWKQLVCAKLIFGLGSIVLSVLLAVAIPHIVVARPTHEPMGDIVDQASEYLVMALIPYLVGVTCSVALPGILGGMLTSTVFIVIVSICSLLAGASEQRDLDGWLALWLCGAASAFILTARFGLTLSLKSRMYRFALTVFVVVGLVGAVTYGASHVCSIP